MVKLLDEVNVWEICHYEVDERGELGDCYDNDYVITDDVRYDADWYDELIEAAGYSKALERGKSCIQVYQARTATLCVDKGNRLTVWEADCATGYSGSPVYEKYSDDVKLDEDGCPIWD